MARKLRWTDVNDIAIELEEAHPDADNVNLRFTDLHKWVMALSGRLFGISHSEAGGLSTVMKFEESIEPKKNAFQLFVPAWTAAA